MLATALFESGKHSQAEISRQAVHQWHQAWSKGGTNALHPGQQGADTLLAPEQERELVSLLLQGPGAHGWDDLQ